MNLIANVIKLAFSVYFELARSWISDFPTRLSQFSVKKVSTFLLRYFSKPQLSKFYQDGLSHLVFKR